MNDPINRREILLQAAATATLTAAGLKPAWSKTSVVQSGPFDADSTAEEVTAGIDLTGKTILITGVNSGLGFETMGVLARHDAHVLGAARTQAKAENACHSVPAKTTCYVAN